MIGFPPRYSTYASLSHRSTEERLVLFWLAAESLEWEVGTATPDSLTAFTHFSLKSWNEQVSIDFSQEEIELFSVSTGVQVLDFGRNRQNVIRLLRALHSIDAAIAPEELEAAILERRHLIRPEGETVHLTRSRRVVNGFTQVFKPVKGYFVTPILIVLNALIFLITTNKWLFPQSSGWTPAGEALNAVGANYKPLTLFGEPWRLVSAGFLHANGFHLFFNMYAVMMCGIYLEPLLGRARFALVYLLTGIGGALAGLWWYDITPSLGASASVFGLFGFILALLLHKFIEPRERKALLVSIGIYLVMNLASIFFSTNYDHAAHFGGLFCGLLMGLLWLPGLRPTASANRKTGFTVLGLAVCGAIFSAAYFLAPRDVNVYLEKRTKMDENYLMASGAYTARTNEERMKWLKNYAIYYMDENLRIMDEVDKLHLAQDSRRQNRILRKIYTTQKQLFVWNYKTLSEGKNPYDTEILRALKQLDSLQQQLDY
ncbi:rhomboid family intramembrane serine protease [Chitinophaga caseinilytica]|uniref:Rhomboid family intramembrane serine protease n=1 Tax=Chitinophaga caseinilytica TaxID=2267521 RepID=A0ABZ2Z7P1_9BACT